MMRTFGWLAAAAGLSGCLDRPEPGGGQIGEEAGAHCEVITRTEIGPDEATSLGFTAGDVLDYAVGTFEDTLVYADGAGVALTATLTEVGPLEFLHQEVVDDSTGTGPEPALAPFCPDVISIGASATFVTADGVFDEAWDGALVADTAAVASLWHDLDAVGGTFDPWDHVADPSGYDEVRAWVEMQLSPSGLSGVVTGQASGSSGDADDPDGTAFAENLDIATFAPDDGV